MNIGISVEYLYLVSDIDTKQWALVIGVPKLLDNNLILLPENSLLMSDIINGTEHSEPVYNPTFSLAGQPSRTVTVVPIADPKKYNGCNFNEGMQFFQFSSNPIPFELLEIVTIHPDKTSTHYNEVDEFLQADTHNATVMFVVNYKGEEYLINYRHVRLL